MTVTIAVVVHVFTTHSCVSSIVSDPNFVWHPYFFVELIEDFPSLATDLKDQPTVVLQSLGLAVSQVMQLVQLLPVNLSQLHK